MRREGTSPDFVWLLGSEPETIDPGLASDQPADGWRGTSSRG